MCNIITKMKNIFIYAALLLLGIVIGIIINKNTSDKPKTIVETKPVEVIVEKIQKKIIRDTVVITKSVTNEISDSLNINNKIDSIGNEVVIDSLETPHFEDITADEEDIIISEKLLSKRLVTVEKIEMDTIQDASELLGMKSETFAEEIMIEFWKSPINITGYELSRNKLKLYGFNPNEKISLIYNTKTSKLFLNTETMSIVLEKSNQFKKLNLK